MHPQGGSREPGVPPVLAQLGELRDAFDKFEAAGIKLYALSYDDQETLAEFAQKQGGQYKLLSDTNSRVIKQYGLLNEQLSKKDAFLYGIPYPGVFVCDEDGTVISMVCRRRCCLTSN